ncbi:winged helix-turn-helix transcriptional regulator [Streptomyces sp. NBRC 110028]|uniref:winged helix-turn-helix transcriptional regulator n=1 Tax=Streptomyces sp. NBRC 110028 TaxID=1621260 RepID=UPI001F2878DE|nr:winged helix-turn-helix transcriptional regulator [Streptomyces sp. NBRC 110028]
MRSLVPRAQPRPSERGAHRAEAEHGDLLEVYDEVPPRVAYSLTAFGTSLNEALAPSAPEAARTSSTAPTTTDSGFSVAPQLPGPTAAPSTCRDSTALPGTRTARVLRASRRSERRRAKVAVRARIEIVAP